MVADDAQVGPKGKAVATSDCVAGRSRAAMGTSFTRALYESPGGEGTTPPGLSRRYQASDTGLPVFADSVAASARRRASIASSMDGVGLVPATTASMNAVSSMR